MLRASNSLIFLLNSIVLSSATSVRLRDSDSTSYRSYKGRVEVYHNSTWGTICDDFWTDDDASVICRMLNFRKGGKAYSNAHFGAGRGQIWLDDVNCTIGRTVNDISDCHHLSWGTNNCGHNEDAGVVCTFLDIRLVNENHDDNGRVEVYHSYSWGTVCDDNWNSYNSRVACRQLGYRDQLYFNGSAAYGQGTGPILMDDVNCPYSPLPERIWNCSFSGWGTNDCGHSEDVGVACAKNEVRLVNGIAGQTGRVEIRQDSTWGTVCDDSFGDVEALVVCRMLGYKYGNALSNAHFGPGTGTIYVDDLDCSPSYTRSIHALLLGDTLCSFNGWGKNNCGHSEDVGVWCSSQELRIVTEHLSGQGRIEITYSGTWGTICSTKWDKVATRIACETLGYRNGIPFHPKPGSGSIWLDNVHCSSTTNHIATCSHSGWGVHNCNHYKDAGVWCVRRDYDVVLAEGSDRFGRVEIYYSSSFRSLCYGYLDTHNADVLCRLVGHRYGGRIFKNPYYVESTTSYLRYLRCEGTESRISSCNSTRGYYTCPRGNDIWIDCITTCDDGKFGHLCNQECHCKVPGCDIGSGRCRRGGCSPGWKGSSCSQECGHGTFGQSCSSRCHCGSSGCDPITGVCIIQGRGCIEGWTGHSCSRGVCDDGWTGYSCDRECRNGTFGQGCSHSCHCKTPGCDHVTGRCYHQNTGCEDGWTGSSCETECGLGLFGGNCSEICHCLVPGCDPVTGVCNISDCQSGWLGQSCNIRTQAEQQKSTSEELTKNYFFIAVICLGVLLVISIVANVWLYVTRKRRETEDDTNNEPCYQNVPRRQRDLTTSSQPQYEDLQVRNVAKKAYENVSYESGYDTVEFRVGGSGTAHM